MRTALLVVLLGLCLLLCGCDFGVPFAQSLQPFYTEEDVVLAPALVGLWQEQPRNGEQPDEGPPAVWAFREIENASGDGASSYELKITERDRWVTFTVHLFEVGQTRFLDLYPEDVSPEVFGKPAEPSEEGDAEDEPECVLLYLFHLLRVHSVARVRLTGDDLTLSPLSDDFVAAQASEKTLLLPYAEGLDSLVLTASPEQLRAFLLEHAAEDEAFLPLFELKRLKSDTAASTG